jgi:GNAT superfamily N-acetyltransferase
LSLYQSFAKRGYRLIEVSNVLIRELKGTDKFVAVPPGITVRPPRGDEARLWAQVVAQGFADSFPVTDALLDVMEGFFHRDGTCSFFLALAGQQPAGGGAAAAYKGVGGLFGASTLPSFRRRGVQSALLAERLRWAQQQDCDLAVSIAQPGGASQRNIERFGFHVAYTRTKLSRAKPG